MIGLFKFWLIPVVSLLLLALLVIEGDEMNTPKVRYSLRAWGTDPSQMQLRVASNNRIPLIERCTKLTLDGSMWSPYLTAHAREQFEAPDDIQEALDEAVLAAIDELTADMITICENSDTTPPCWMNPPNEHTATVNDATVKVRIYWSWGMIDDGGLWESDCSSEDMDSYGQSRLDVTITAPRQSGINLRPLLESLNLDGMPGDVPVEYANTIKSVVQDLLAQERVIGTVTGGGSSVECYLPGPDGRGVTIVSGPPGTVTVHSYSTSPDATMESSYASVTGTLDGSVVFSGKTEDYVRAIGYLWGYPDGGEAFPSSFTLTNEDNSPRTVNAVVPFTNNWHEEESGNSKQWRLNSDYTPLATDTLRSTGVISQSNQTSRRIKEPGFKSACQWDATFVNRRAAHPLCDEIEMQLNVAAVTGFQHPPGKFPKCRTVLKAVLPKPEEA